MVVVIIKWLDLAKEFHPPYLLLVPSTSSLVISGMTIRHLQHRQ